MQFEASDVDFNMTGEALGGDVVASVLSTIGMPAAVVTYFEASARSATVFRRFLRAIIDTTFPSPFLPDST